MTDGAGATTTQGAVTPQIVQHARSPRFRGDFGWIVGGAARQKEGVGLAAIVTWTGLPIALWLAALGALAGALLGAFGFTATGFASSLHLNESVGVLGALLGAIEGIAAGFAAVYLLFFHSPAAFVGAVASGLIIGSVTLVILLVAEGLAMPLRGYRELSRRESERLYPLLLRAGAQMGLSVVPMLWMSDSQKPAAWCHPTAIVVTRGLIGEADASEAGPQSDLDDAALGAVLAHELHHWAVGDPVGLRAVWSCFWPVVALYNAAAWVRTRGGGVFGVVAWLLLWPAWITVKLIVVPFMAGASRRNEYEADAAAASLGDDYRLGLRRALTELAMWEKPRTGWEDALAATHPPIELRLERLEAGPAAAAAPYSAPITVPPAPEWYAVNVRATAQPIRALTDQEVLDRALDAHHAVTAYQEAYRSANLRRIEKAKERSDAATRAFLDAVEAGLRAAGLDPKAYFPPDHRHTVNITLPNVDVAIYEQLSPRPAAATPAATTMTTIVSGLDAAAAAASSVANAPETEPRPQPASERGRARRVGSDQAVRPPATKMAPAATEKAAHPQPGLTPPPTDDTEAAARWLRQPDLGAPPVPKRRLPPTKPGSL